MAGVTSPTARDLARTDRSAGSTGEEDVLVGGRACVTRRIEPSAELPVRLPIAPEDMWS
jgi:hypothetical protein